MVCAVQLGGQLGAHAGFPVGICRKRRLRERRLWPGLQPPNSWDNRSPKRQQVLRTGFDHVVRTELGEKAVCQRHAVLSGRGDQRPLDGRREVGRKCTCGLRKLDSLT